MPVIASEIAAVVASDEIYYATTALCLRNPTLINFPDGSSLPILCHAIGHAPVGRSVTRIHGSDHRALGIGLAIEAALRRV